MGSTRQAERRAGRASTCFPRACRPNGPSPVHLHRSDDKVDEEGVWSDGTRHFLCDDRPRRRVVHQAAHGEPGTPDHEAGGTRRARASEQQQDPRYDPRSVRAGRERRCSGASAPTARRA